MSGLFAAVGRAAGLPPDRNWPDDLLLEGCRKGDGRAWEALIAKYKNLVYAIPFRYGASEGDAADIFQMVWVDLYHELPRLRNTAGLRSWLITVAGRHALRWKRRQTRRGEVEFPEENEPGDESPLPLEAMEEVERDQSVREAVAALPDRCREMVEMLFLSDPPAPYEDVAARFGLATGSIGFIRGRCLAKLRKLLEDRGLCPK